MFDNTHTKPAVSLALIFWIVVVLLILPLWTSPVLPLVDFTNHLARCWILDQYHSVEAFQHTYTVVQTPMSNVAMDATVPADACSGSYNSGPDFRDRDRRAIRGRMLVDCQGSQQPHLVHGDPAVFRV